MSHSLKFAHLLAGDLRAARVEAVPRRCYRVSGRLDVDPVIVSVGIAVPWWFRDLKRHPPPVWCSEPWMKTGADWHNGPPLCWVIPDEWRDAMSWRGKPVRAILDEGRRWLVGAVGCLVCRHYVAHLEGLSAWPAEWAAWSHGLEGVREYRQTKRAATARNQRKRK